MLEQGAEAECVAGAVAKAGFCVQVGEFANGGNQFGMKAGGRSKLEGSLRAAARIAAFFEKAKKLCIEARSEQRIGLAG